jgi:hypothetical protein
MNQTPRRRRGSAGPPATDAPVPSGQGADDADLVAGVDRPDAPDARDRGSEARDGEESVSDAGRDGIEGVREAGPDDWIDPDPASPDADRAPRPGPP